MIESNKRSLLISEWSAIKWKLCGTDKCELKWSHFFPGYHQERMSNPLLSTDSKVWRNQAKWALEKLFESVSMTPIVTYVRKDRASKDVFEIKEDDRRILNTDVIWIGILGQFAIFLEQQNALGEIWFDQLGSRKEEARKQVEWDYIREGDWPIKKEHKDMIQRISPTLRFFDSQEEPMIQIADFISGIAWAASERDEDFILNYIDKFNPTQGRTFQILNIE